jgi:hypothetical protein
LSTGLGIGVTADSEIEARELAENTRSRYYPTARLTAVVPDIDFAALDQEHVVPNAGPLVVLGVWYPRLNI